MCVCVCVCVCVSLLKQKKCLVYWKKANGLSVWVEAIATVNVETVPHWKITSALERSIL